MQINIKLNTSIRGNEKSFYNMFFKIEGEA